MLPSLLLPKFSPPRRAGLHSVKALLPLGALSLLLLPLPSWAGGWTITYSDTGENSYDQVGPTITPYWDCTYTNPVSGAGFSPYPGCVDASITGSVTATLTWQPAPGQTMASDPPPTKPVGIKEVATAQESPGSWGGGGPAPTPAGTASDGLGDPPVASGSGYLSTGAHLIKKDGSSGTIVLDPVSMSAACPQTHIVNGSPDWMWTDSVNVNLSVQLDNRDVAIHSDLEPTFRRGSAAGQIVQNTPAISGAMFADTVAPDASLSVGITYLPIYSRSAWGTASNYAWSFSSGGSSIDPQSGTFNTVLYDVSSPQLSYPFPKIQPGSSESVSLKLTDSQDGASATNTYSVLFHAPYELWKDGPIVRHPVAFVSGGPNMVHPDYSYLLTITNGSSVPQIQNLTSAVSLAETESGTVSGQQTLTPAGIAAFQLNESITVGKTLTYTYTTQSTLTGAAHKVTQFFAAMSYEDRTGTCDVFAKNGYQGNFPWQGRWSNGGVSLGISELPY